VYSTALQGGPGAAWWQRPACCIRHSISFRFRMSFHHGGMSPSLRVVHRMLLRMIVWRARTVAGQFALMSRLRTTPRPSLDAVRVAEAGRQEQKLIRIAFKLTGAGTGNAIRPITRVRATCTDATSIRMRTERHVQNACEREQRRCNQSQKRLLLFVQFRRIEQGQQFGYNHPATRMLTSVPRTRTTTHCQAAAGGGGVGLGVVRHELLQQPFQEPEVKRALFDQVCFIAGKMLN
jgi:hypothetical protein